MYLPRLSWLAVLVLSGNVAAAQDAPATIVIDADTLNSFLNQNEGDNPLSVIDSEDGQLGIFMLSSPPRPAPADGAVTGGYHSAISEIYHVIRGTGTFVTDGELRDATEVEQDSARYSRAGPGASGPLANATLVEYGPGTIFIVPPGVPHNATHEVTSETDFLIYRFDPDRVLPPH
jgi:hypothetical protein